MPGTSPWIGLSILGLGVCLAVVQGKVHARLARLEVQVNALLRHFAIEPTAGAVLSDRVKDLAREPSKKIEAIRAHREETGASLAEAKAAVEAFAAGR